MANIDYEEKLTQVDAEKQQALTDAEETYGGMIGEAQKYYQEQIAASKEWAGKQQELQQAQTDLAIEQIEQQKEQTKKDYTKEQSGAYVDWQKESNRYGVSAEQMAAAGLADTGYSESSQVGMYNEYQNRVAVARASYEQAVINYNNAIREAQLQNSSALAEIAYTALQQQLELSLQGFQYENQLMFALEDRKAQIEDTYHGRYLDVLDQMNAENALAEQARQYNQNYELQMKEYEEGVRQFDLEMERLKALDEEEKRQFDLMYEQSSAGITKDDETTSPEIGAGTNAARSTATGQVVSGYYPGRTTENKEIKDYIENVLKDPMRQTGKEDSTVEKNQNTGVQKIGNPVITGYIGKLPITSPMVANGLSMKAIQATANRSLAAAETIAAKKNMSVAGKNTNSSHQQKLANDEKKLANDEKKYSNEQKKAVGTEYYEGPLNQDAGVFGVMSNGYQPKGVSGHGELTKTGDNFYFYTTKKYGSQAGRTVQVKQNVWEAEDGTLWYWNGRENMYKPMPGV